jgi:hypothetical protein
LNQFAASQGCHSDNRQGVFLSSVLLLRADVEAVFFNSLLLVFFKFVSVHFWMFTGITSGRKWLPLQIWRLERKCLNRRQVTRWVEREKTINNQIKSNQIKSNQIKSNQIKSNQIKSMTVVIHPFTEIFILPSFEDRWRFYRFC